MAAARTKTTKSNNIDRRQLELVDNNVDQARRDYNPFWGSTLFDEIYLRNDVPSVYKNIWHPDDEMSGAYSDFFTQLMNLSEDLQKMNLKSLNEENTINKIIKPMLTLLVVT